MTEVDKELLFKDLSARLPYGVKIMFSYNGFHWDWEQTLNEIRQCEDGEYAINNWGIHGIKPYLRPISNMTKEEEAELLNICGGDFLYKGEISIPIAHPTCESVELSINTIIMVTNWLYSHHFDVNGLIEKGLALPAPNEMYKIKNYE